jgi:hypothetical protein
MTRCFVTGGPPAVINREKWPPRREICRVDQVVRKTRQPHDLAADMHAGFDNRTDIEWSSDAVGTASRLRGCGNAKEGDDRSIQPHQVGIAERAKAIAQLRATDRCDQSSVGECWHCWPALASPPLLGEPGRRAASTSETA